MSESENDEDFVPDAKAEKEYESEMARQKIEPTNEKEFFNRPYFTFSRNSTFSKKTSHILLRIDHSGFSSDGKHFFFIF